MRLIPYLNFNGNCREAFDFYAKALNGKIVARFTYGESPMAAEMPKEGHGNIMHSAIHADGAVIMGADGPGASGETGAITVNVDVGSIEEAERIFAALAEGGTVHMPIAETFWAHRWGMLVDRYGKPWMVNCMKPAA